LNNCTLKLGGNAHAAETSTMQPKEIETAEKRRQEMVETARKLGEYYRHISLEYATLRYPYEASRPTIPAWLAKTYETR